MKLGEARQCPEMNKLQPQSPSPDAVPMRVLCSLPRDPEVQVWAQQDLPKQLFLHLKSAVELPMWWAPPCALKTKCKYPRRRCFFACIHPFEDPNFRAGLCRAPAFPRLPLTPAVCVPHSNQPMSSQFSLTLVSCLPFPAQVVGLLLSPL